MRHFLITVVGVFAGLALFAACAVALVITLGAQAARSSVEQRSRAAPPVSVLAIDLRLPLSDQGVRGAFGLGGPPSLIDLVDALARAETDLRVKGAFIRAPEFGLSPAQAEELADSLASFRKAGKFVVVHAQGFESTSFIAYMAAAYADELWLQANGSFVATGLSIETPFYGGVFEKFGAKPEFEQFHEYKSAANVYTEKSYTEAHRESLETLLDGLFADALAKAAEARATTPEALRGIVERGPYSAQKALELGLVDRLGHVLDAQDAALARAGAHAALIEASYYLRIAGKPHRKGPVIALVAGQGAIVTGIDRSGPFGGPDLIFSDTVADAIEMAAKDDRVEAIVLRVDSPGGSATASDQIWNAVKRAQAKGKPVVASFASVAASGGYYMSVGADAILAQPTTITGSIGVLGGKLVLDETYGIVGYNVEPLSVGGPFTLAYSETRSFTPEQRAAYRAMLAGVYDDFTGKVADGRSLPIDRVRLVAKGRIWTGRQAMERGLVDELGGLRAAIERAKALAGLDADAEVTLRRYPAPRSPIAALQQLLGVGAEGAEALARLDRLLSSPEIAAALEARQALEADATLYAPPVVVR